MRAYNFSFTKVGGGNKGNESLGGGTEKRIGGGVSKRRNPWVQNKGKNCIETLTDQSEKAMVSK